MDNHLQIDAQQRASRHAIERHAPAVDFFEGALLGNGALGVVVCSRPDSVVLYLGHNDVWDIRVWPTPIEKLGAFDQMLDRLRKTWADGGTIRGQGWFSDFCKTAREGYAKIYPRPMPCGMIVLGFDPRHVEVTGHRVDIARGRCELFFLVRGQPQRLEVMVDMTRDRVWLSVRDADGRPAPSPFNRVRLLPDDGMAQAAPFDVAAPTWAGRPEDALPQPVVIQPTSPHVLGFRQRLPRQIDGQKIDPRDRAFRVTWTSTMTLQPGQWTSSHGTRVQNEPLERWTAGNQPMLGCVQLDQGLDSQVPQDLADVTAPQTQQWQDAQAAAADNWRNYWSRSAVALDDPLLEQTWYRNLYFLHCALKPGTTCPGLFANWSHKAIGTAWHGDYHLDYNFQQPFWVTFSSNHNDKLLPYADAMEHFGSVARQWAKDYYGLRGACYPVTLYPVEMEHNPYPLPTWGWILCCTPWVVQNLWWHYLYTLDETFLRQRAWPILRDAAAFMADFIEQAAHIEFFPQDGRAHIGPTVAPELYGLTDRFARNFDSLADLTLTRFLFRAYLKAWGVLGNDPQEQALAQKVQALLERLAPLPTAQTPEGPVFVAVPGEEPGMVYNCPISTMSVFPGEEHGLDSPPDQYQLAARTYRQQRNEGGNELVFLNLQGARLGLLNLERFKRQIAYCLLPNGTCSDRALQVHGRYRDTTAYHFMDRMGVWLENFALPAVLNECLMQSYSGTIRLFPNWPREKDAAFCTLRAAGAFLVSADLTAGQVRRVEIQSEKGAPLRLMLPWPKARCESDGVVTEYAGPMLQLPTRPGQQLLLTPA